MMRMTMLFLLILLGVASLAQGKEPATTQPMPSIGADAPFDGDWVGGFERGENLVFVQTHFGAAKEGTIGTVDVIDVAAGTRIMGKPLDKLEFTPSHAHFELPDVTSGFSFEGRLADGVMTGMIKYLGDTFPFQLNLIAKIDPTRYVGVYQIEAGHSITVLPLSIIACLTSFDSQSGQMALLLPRDKDDFLVWTPGVEPRTAEATVHFIANQLGQSTTMQWKAPNAPALVGTPIKLPEKEVSFKNGETTLSGTLVLPLTKGPHPAIVLIHGSGPGVRETYRLFANFFALNGVATLIYDKRGCGTSTGDWQESGFDDFAGDALAGLEVLKSRADINPHQMGLWGISQGGWIVSLAAAHSADVAFIISVSGPGITPEEQGAFMIEHRMKAAGFSAADFHDALSLYRLDSRCAQTNSGWDELKAARRAAQKKPWYEGDVTPYGSGDPELKQWQLIWNYDPVPRLRKVHCPVLSIFGEMDPLVPAQKSADAWKAALTDAGNQDVTIKIFPHADHGIADTRDGIPLPAYFRLQRDWLLKRVNIIPQ